jgi:hypothetical protein
MKNRMPFFWIRQAVSRRFFPRRKTVSLRDSLSSSSFAWESPIVLLSAFALASTMSRFGFGLLCKIAVANSSFLLAFSSFCLKLYIICRNRRER